MFAYFGYILYDLFQQNTFNHVPPCIFPSIYLITSIIHLRSGFTPLMYIQSVQDHGSKVKVMTKQNAFCNVILDFVTKLCHADIKGVEKYSMDTDSNSSFLFGNETTIIVVIS